MKLMMMDRKVKYHVKKRNCLVLSLMGVESQMKKNTGVVSYMSIKV